jgi:hypothetical protein
MVLGLFAKLPAGVLTWLTYSFSFWTLFLGFPYPGQGKFILTMSSLKSDTQAHNKKNLDNS